jgi:hypothetical protein
VSTEVTYLGDGPSASFDGFQIALIADRGSLGARTVYLEADVYAALVRFATSVDVFGGGK